MRMVGILMAYIVDFAVHCFLNIGIISELVELAH